MNRVSLVTICYLVAAQCAIANDTGSPRTPDAERSTFQFADPNLTVELIAAEPDIESPVAIAWDAVGRMYVAEMRGYPEALGAGRIRQLTDRDGDGRYEHAVTFADGMNFPTSVLPYQDGVFVTAAPDILYLRDLDGDGSADERKVIFTGFHHGNEQLLVNGLYWGHDNWVYGANGRSDGAVGRPDQPADQAISIRTQDFRFHPETLKFEPLPGQSQFGTTRDDWGNRFLSWNTIPIRQALLAAEQVRRSPQLATEAIVDIAAKDESGRIFPISRLPKQFNAEPADAYNAVCGLMIYRGDALGTEFQGNAFAGESLTNLVLRRVLQADGPAFVARDAEPQKEFLASTDGWFHPVNYATGPDGALYVVDFYRKFVEHPDWVAPTLRDSVPWEEGHEHGRIWRVVRRDGKPRGRMPTSLAAADTETLVKELAHANAWRRDTAQRLLVETKQSAAVRGLQALLTHESPLARVHAAWTLDGLAALRNEDLLDLLADADERVRAAAVQLAGERLSKSSELQTALIELQKDSSELVRFHLALALSNASQPQGSHALARLFAEHPDDQWLWLAVESSAAAAPASFLESLVQVKSVSLWHRPTPRQFQTLQRIARQAAATAESQLSVVVEHLAEVNASEAGLGHLAIYCGLADQLQSPPLIDLAMKVAAGGDNHPQIRVAAVELLAAKSPSDLAGNALLGIMKPEQPVQVQLAAATAIVRLDDPKLVAEVLGDWNKHPSAVRRVLLAHLARAERSAPMLLSELERNAIAIVELDDAARQALANHADAEVRTRAAKLLAAAQPADRQNVLHEYQSSLNLKGNRQQGAKIFAAHCVSCHSVHGRGQRVGPDLTGAASRPAETLLVDVLDPSRQVSPDFLAYSLLTEEGRVFTGLLVAESAGGVTIREAGGIEHTISRGDIDELRPSGKSLMPDGMEQKLSPADVADLLEFLRRPDRDLLPVQ